MRRSLLVLASGLLLMSCAALPAPGHAANQPNILIMGEDADKDTVPCSSRVFKRALAALSNQVSEEGFTLFDETAVTLDDFVQGRCRRTDAELIDIARSIKAPPIDVAVIFSIYASADQLTYTTKIKDRVMGRLLDIRTGKRLGSFEVKSPRTTNAPRDCPRECILEAVGDETRILAQDLGAVLGIKLRSQVADKTGDPVGGDRVEGLATAFVVIIDGFKPEEVNDVEEYLVSFQGYEHHRPTRCSIRRCEYWYETSSDSARLNRNLRRMMTYLGVQGRVTFADDNTLLVEKIVGSN